LERNQPKNKKKTVQIYIVFSRYLRSEQFGGQKSLGPLEKPLEIADFVFCPHRKITSRTIRISGALIVEIYPNLGGRSGRWKGRLVKAWPAEGATTRETVVVFTAAGVVGGGWFRPGAGNVRAGVG
jgi:hypothetical protein